MWLLHARFVWSGLIAEHCSLPLLMPDKQRATIPGFNAGLKQERLKSWDSAYPPLRGSSHIARSISEKSLILFFSHFLFFFFLFVVDFVIH